MTREAPADLGLTVPLFAAVVLAPFNYLIAVPLGSATIHPLHIWAALALPYILTTRPQAFLVGCDVPALMLWTGLVFVLSSTVLGTPTEYKDRGLLDVLLLGLNLVTFTLVCGLLRTTGAWIACMRALFVASLVASAFLAARAVVIAQTGVFEEPDSYMLGLGTVRGTYTSALAAASVIGMVFARGPRLLTLSALGVSLHAMAATVALARGPWLAFAAAVFVAGVWMLIGARGHLVRLFWRVPATLTLLASSIAAAALLSATVAQMILSRFADVADVSGGTGGARLALFQRLLQDALAEPLFGHGASTYRQVSELLDKQGSVSENFFLEMFHAGGLAAALPLTIAVAIVLLRLTRSGRRGERRVLSGICLSGLVALVLGSLTNPAAWDTSFWVMLAAGATIYTIRSVPSLPVEQPVTAS